MHMSLLFSLKVSASCPAPLPQCARTLRPVAKQTLIKQTVFDPEEQCCNWEAKEIKD